jgi:hypothetical protein
MPPVFGYQPMAMPSAVPSPHHYPTEAVFSFDSTSFPPEQQSFSFGASSSSAHTTAQPSASVVHPQPPILTTLSSRKTLKPSSSTHDDRAVSMKSSFAPTYIQNESTNLDSATIKDVDFSHAKHRKSSMPSFSRGGSGRGRAVPEIEDQVVTIATLQDAIYASSLQSMRFTDVCKDRITHELFIKTIAYCRYDVTNKIADNWWHR